MSGSAGSPTIDLDDLLGDAAINRPFEFYTQLREHDPVYFNERWNGWVLTSHDDVAAGFRDHERLSSDRFAGPFGREWRSERDVSSIASVMGIISKFFSLRDAPFHTRVRALVGKAFTARNVEHLRDEIAGLVEELMEPLRGRDDVDFLAEFAYHLPVTVITAYLGIPSESRAALKQWSQDLSAVLFVRGNDPDRVARADRAVQELTEYLRPILRERRRAPQEDLLTALVHSRDDDAVLSEDELIATIVLIVFGGHETTMNLMANAVVGFDRFPEEWALLSERPELLRSATEEMLRYDGPLHAQGRWATTSFELGGKRIERFDRVLLHQTAANHDPAAFERPDELDVTRRPNRHVAFGQGVHTCIGGPLARLETQEAFAYLTRHFGEIEILDRELRHHPTIVSRSLERLHVRFVER